MSSFVAAKMIPRLHERGMFFDDLPEPRTYKEAVTRAVAEDLNSYFTTTYEVGSDLLKAIERNDKVFPKWTIWYFSEEWTDPDGILFAFSNDVDAVYAKMLL
jgi:hypothetical protein